MIIDECCAINLANNFVLVPFCYDLSIDKNVHSFFEEIKEKFNPSKPIDCMDNYGQLDVFINNAGVFDFEGYEESKTRDGKFNLTFMVNTYAPFILSYRILTELDPQP